MQSLDKALDFFIELTFCKSDFYFLNRPKICKVFTYNILSVYEDTCAFVHKTCLIIVLVAGMTATLRGRPLHGQVMNVPSGYTGRGFFGFL